MKTGDLDPDATVYWTNARMTHLKPQCRNMRQSHREVKSAPAGMRMSGKDVCSCCIGRAGESSPGKLYAKKLEAMGPEDIGL